MKNMRKILTLVLVLMTILFVGCEFTFDTTKSDSTIVEETSEALLQDVTLDNITGDIALVPVLEGVTISWSSSNPDVISSTGKVTPKQEDTTVILYATLTLNDYTTTKSWTVVVKGTGEGNGEDTPQPDQPTDDIAALANALKHLTKFDVVYSVTDSDGTYDMNYTYDNNIMKQTFLYEDGTTGTEYLAERNNVLYYYFQDANGDWYYMDENNADFANSTGYFWTLDFSTISANDFTLSNGVYSIDSAKANTIATNVFTGYDDEVFTDFDIELGADGFVSTIAAASNYYVYVLTFTNIDATSLTLPSAEEYVATSSDITDIADLYTTVEDGTEVNVYGVVVATIGNNFFIADQGNGVYVYMGSTSDFTANIAVGKEVLVTGSKTTYKGWVELQNVSAIEFGDEYTVEATELQDLSSTTLGNNVSTLVNYTGALIVTKSTYTSGKDYSITVSDGTNEALLFANKNIDSSVASTITTLIASLNVGDSINIENASIGCYNNYQIYLVDQSSVTVGYKEGDAVVLSKLSTSPASLAVPYGTSLEDAMDLVTVTKKYNNGDTEAALPTEYTYSCSSYSATLSGVYTVTIKIGTISCTINVEVLPQAQGTFKATIGQFDSLESIAPTMGEYEGVTYGVTIGMPSTGNVNILVVPVLFSGVSTPTNYKSTLEKGIFGTSEETGWESLKSYYNRVSYGKLNIEGTILDIYKSSMTVSEAETAYKSDEYFTDKIVKEVFEYYDSTVDYSLYDADENGYVDGIYLVYLNSYTTTSTGSDLWWAFTTEFLEEVSSSDDETRCDGVGMDFYMWMSYKFFEEAFMFGTDDGFVEDQYVAVNAQTVIHETGHMLGLTDYYSYETNGASASIMMDYNVGDHDAFSKIILGWTAPTIVSGTTSTVTLSSFESTGDCLLVSYNWNGSYFSEYLIIDYYTPTGVNEIFANYSPEYIYSGVYTTEGVRIYHIDATLASPSEVGYIWGVYKNDNDKATQLIELVRASNDYSSYMSSDDDLYTEGTSLTNFTWHNGTTSNFQIHVDSIKDGKATITVQY